MPKKILYASICLCAILYAADINPAAQNQPTQNDAQKEHGRGWLKYEDETRQPQNNIDPNKVSEKELLLQLIQEQKIANRIQLETLELLKVVHDLPRMVEVDGKKCLSNSSEDCFVMPIIGDGARIPVMKKWLENPSVENALAYYKWQAKYLNHALNAGYSLEAAAKNTRYPFAGTPRHLNRITGEAHTQREKMTKDILKKHASKMEIAVLMGKNYGYDVEDIQNIRYIYDEMTEIGAKIRFVFETQESLNRFNEFHKNAINLDATKLWTSIPDTQKVVSPNSFKDSKIDTYMTPMYIFRYLDMKNNKSFNQVVGIGRDEVDTIIKSITRTMILFNVIKPEELAGTHAQKYQTEDLIKQIDGRSFLNDEEEKNRAPAMRELLEKEKEQ